MTDPGSDASQGRRIEQPDNNVLQFEMRDHYDFNGGVRGKYAKGYAEGSNVVVLDPDVAEHFKTSEDVNRALRELTA